jgi:hypothetical protein
LASLALSVLPGDALIYTPFHTLTLFYLPDRKEGTLFAPIAFSGQKQMLLQEKYDAFPAKWQMICVSRYISRRF